MIKHSFKALTVVALLAVTLPRGADAQALSTPLLPVTPRIDTLARSTLTTAPVSPDAASPRPSYWLLGGIIGALVFAGAAAWFSRICESSDVGGSCGAPRVKFILGAIPLGFITGALIGGNIHPHQAEPPPSQ